MAKQKLPKPVTLDQAINALRELTEWDSNTGSWEAPCWKYAHALLNRWRDQQEQEHDAAQKAKSQTVLPAEAAP